MNELLTNKVFDLLEASDKRITVMQGGTRSGKTYNILIWFINGLSKVKGKTLTICRESMPSLKGSVMRDFMEILGKMNIYNEGFHNKTESTYLLNGNLVEFVSIDQPQKIRGRKRDYLFINEANELHYEDWLQLAFRTTEKIVLDYNPSDEFSWIYEQVIPRNDCDFFITTYLDNPFLDQSLIEEIERLKDADENYWKVYGLGQRGMSRETVYTHWTPCHELPGKGEVFYGQDFGYSVPSALVKVEVWENKIYAKEIIYETKLTTNDLIERYKSLNLQRYDEIFCDSAEPKTIEEMKRAGFNVKPSDKDVWAGIQKVKSMPLLITNDSPNLKKELQSYKWKTDKDGKITPDEQPVKFNDHLLDALRYAVHTKLTTKSPTWVAL